jgi:hypothetical protein
LSAPITIQLLTRPYQRALQPLWYHGCAVCDRDPGSSARWLNCDRCGAGFHDTCYFAAIASRGECEWWARWSPLARRRLGVEEDEVETPPEVADEEDDDSEDPIFLCQGCRS